MMIEKKEENENKIKFEIEKRSHTNKIKGLEYKINSLLKEINDLKIKNEKLNDEIFFIRNEKNSNIDSNDDKRKSIQNVGFNLNSFLDEPPTKRNSSIINIRELFKNRTNTLKKKFSSKNSNKILIKSTKNLTRDNSSGSKSSNLSVKVIESRYKNNISELNQVSRSHIPLIKRKIDDLNRSEFIVIIFLFLIKI